ncbi:MULTISPECIES: RNA ligase family protein [unclassified Streptomyces]|uniref:RNA ligase family protein n=1 Tax=unclassified Streptomyces TaxID=2593676 RepID=UPI0033D8BF7B
MTEFEFTPWPKTPRLFRDIVITEKLDGTNGGIHIRENEELPGTYSIAAQSRRRLITPSNDNYGFATWVHANAAELITILGPGLHFGEWWGSGIQRRYGLNERRFSLFNTSRWWETDESGTSMHRRAEQSDICDQIDAVPVIYSGTFSEADISRALADLREFGSYAAPGFMNPEGICVYHTQTRNVFKVTLDNQDAGKWEAAA